MKKTKTLLMALALGLGVNAFAADPESNWIVKFNNGYEDEYLYEPGDFHALVVEDGKMGTITFNPNLAGQKYTITDKFVLNGKQFTIDTSGANITFAMPMPNYETDFTVKGEGGSITTLGDAAFKSVTVESGALNVGSSDGATSSQIGVTDQFTVKGGATLSIAKTGRLLLTDQIHNEGSVTIDGIIDASNLTEATAEKMGVVFEDTQGNHGDGVKNGFLYGDNEKPIVWTVTDKESTGVATASNTARIIVATEVLDLNGQAQVVMTETNYNLWFQNEGTQSVYAVTQKGGMGVNIIVNTNTGEATTLNIDGSLSTSNVVYAARNSNVIVDLYPYGYPGGIGNLTILDGATAQISPASGADGQISTLKFIGQDTRLTVRGSVPDGWYAKEHELSPLNFIVESASTATVDADIVPYQGYIERRNMQSGEEPIFGIVNVKGDLFMEGESVMDLQSAVSSTNNAQFNQGEGAATDVDYQEEFAHLYIADRASLQLDTKAKFLASTVADGASIIIDETTSASNLDTRRHFDSVNLVAGTLPSYDDALAAAGEEKPYEVNGRVEISSLSGSRASIISDGDIAGHYTTRNYNYTVSEAELTVTDDYRVWAYDGWRWSSEDVVGIGMGDTTISNVLVGDSVTNAKQNGGKVTLDNAANQDFDTLYAQDGDIAITNNTSVDAKTVHLGAGREVSVSSETPVAPEELLRDGSLTVTELLQADGSKGTEEGKDNYSKIGADLYLVAGSELDVSAAGGNGGIDMLTHAVTFQPNTSSEEPLLWTLSDADYSQLWALEKGGKYDLFFDVSEFDYGKGAQTTAIAPEEALDASRFFSNFKEGWFYLCYSGAGVQGGAGDNVGTIYLYSLVPEPTTGTLSLLALAALAARRRRK